MFRVVVRVDGSPKIGLGHLSRCLTLGKALARRGAMVTYLVSRDSAESLPWIATRGETAAVLDVPPGSPDDARQTAAHAEKLGATLAVVDGYAFGNAFIASVRKTTAVCVIDDLAEEELACDAIVNPNAHARADSYDAASARKLLVGLEYALVREDFVRARERKRCSEPNARRVLVTMGGADPTRATELVMAALHRTRRFEARVVVGWANVELQRQREASPPWINVLVEPDMAAQMEWADVAVSAGGGTCLELACVGVPTLALIVARNQSPGVRALSDAGAVRSLGEQTQTDDARILSALEELANDVDARRNMVEIQRRAVDGKGAARVAESLANLVSGDV